MDLEIARKALSKRGASSSKRIAFIVVAGLCIVAGILLRSGQYFGQAEMEANAPIAVAAPPPPAPATPAMEATKSVPQPPLTAPNEQAEPTGEAVEQPEQASETVEHAGQPEPGSGMILVAKQPVEVLASPSSSAPVMYGFPAGRPFRVIGRDGGFAHIQDLKSSASGWIDETALARPPREPSGSASSQPSADPRPRATNKDTQVTADSEAVTQPARKRPGLFGRGGLFGGIFGNGN